ncbi:MAG: hypothetical protein HXX13_14200 [Bacteroidetes bacterium]|nr:hypothetical protein [Bacteroidota bacterium]
MKRKLNIFLSILILFVAFAYAQPVTAQEPPHPPSTGHGQVGNQNPSGATAPLDGGISILIALCAAYGSRRFMKAGQSYKD